MCTHVEVWPESVFVPQETQKEMTTHVTVCYCWHAPGLTGLRVTGELNLNQTTEILILFFFFSPGTLAHSWDFSSVHAQGFLALSLKKLIKQLQGLYKRKAQSESAELKACYDRSELAESNPAAVGAVPSAASVLTDDGKRVTYAGRRVDRREARQGQ